jgi:hypothetical protein
MMGRLSHDQEHFFYSFRYLANRVVLRHRLIEPLAVEKNGRMLSATY